MDGEQANVALEQVLGVLRRRAPWVVLCAVLVAGAAYGLSKHQTKKYTATASLVFHNNQLGQQIAGLQAANGNETQQAEKNTNIKLLQLGDLSAKTARLLGHGLAKEDVRRAVSVSAEAESNIVEVSGISASPALAAAIANTYTRLFEAEQQSSNHRYYARALKLVNKQLASLTSKERGSAAGLALEGRAQSLGVLAELRNPTVEVAQEAAVPTVPSSPKVTQNTILGAVLGLLLGLGLAFLLERFDRRIREPGDLQEIYGLPLLGVVPESHALARSARTSASKRERRRAREGLPPAEEEAFHLIRAHLRYFNVDRELRTLLVTSAAPRDGKTTVARQLASAAARVGSAVLLLEADLRRPTLAQQLGVEPRPGLADVLIGTESIWSATQPLDPGVASENGVEAEMRIDGQTSDVLVAGSPLPPNPAELLESHAMKALLEQARATYDLVVIDTPPLAAVSDAFPLLNLVDGVVIVGRVGRNRRDVAVRLHETLAGANAPLLGVVANGFKAGRLRSYGYAYDGASDRAYATSTRAERRAPVGAANGVSGYAGNGGNGDASVIERVRQATPPGDLDGERVRRSFMRRDG
jgi:polysaccharide biosynthesis transport protein